MKRYHKPQEVAYVKPAQTPWLTKDDVAKQLSTVHRSFQIADDQCPAWVMADNSGTTPELPNWQVLLHNEVYGPVNEANEGVKRKYFGYVPRDV